MRFPVIATLFAAFVLAGCTTAPIMNVDNTPITTVTGKQLTGEQVRAAIVRAGSSLGWQMKEDGPGKLVGTLNLRTHTAVVDIPYSPNSYSIKYRSSVNLGEANGQIHRNYNGWVQNLTQRINAQLTAS